MVCVRVSTTHVEWSRCNIPTFFGVAEMTMVIGNCVAVPGIFQLTEFIKTHPVHTVSNWARLDSSNYIRLFATLVKGSCTAVVGDDVERYR